MFTLMSYFSKSRFNPKPGILDFWNEFRKPNKYRYPILAAASLPFILIVYALGGETVYGEPERPRIDYVTSFDANRTDAQIMASNQDNQELKELREAEAERVAQRKRDLYKALGAATGMDVESIEEKADADRAAEEAAEEKRQEEMFGTADPNAADAGPADSAVENSESTGS